VEGEPLLERAEVAALLAARGLGADDVSVEDVLARTGGRADQVVLDVRRLAVGHGGSGPGIPVEADALAGLPLLSPGLVDALLGPGAWRGLTASGATLQPRSDGWYVPASAPGAGRATAEQRAVAARWYADHGQLALAVRWLHAAGAEETLAGVLADTLHATDRARRWAEIADLDPGELEAVVRRWPDDLVRRTPEALLALVRAVEFGMHAQLRADWLARLGALVAEDDPVWIAVEAEQVRELSRQGKADQVHARAAVARPRADEISRARLLMAESIVDLLHQQREAEGPARDMLREATALLRVNGEREWEADAWLSLGFGADLRSGRLGLAVEHIERALALCSPGTQMRGRVLTFLAEALSNAGRPDDAEAALREVAELAAARDDVALTAYVAWSAALVACRRGDLAATREQLAVVEAHRGEWHALPAGVAFHAEAAEMLATLGQYDDAQAQLDVARRLPAAADFGNAFDMPELVLAARAGDPTTVPALAARCSPTPLTAWRIRLLEAWAAERGGDPDGARRLVAEALAEAEALGHPEIVEAVEPELALWARATPVERGSAARRSGTTRVRLMGAPAVETPQGLREPRRGDETTLLAAVAARHDTEVDGVLDLLWPGEADAVARRRLRNTLNRLRGSVGEVVVRRGDRLALAPDVAVDVHLVVQAARIGHTVPELGVEAARRALALVAGELANPGGDPVLDDLRDELSLAVGVLADRVSDAATTTGELGEAARWLTTARRLDRYDEHRAVRLVQVLRALGRDAEAADVLDDAVSACGELGVPPSPDLERLARR
jgi:DNA-binding SARP family transcriptional activator/tetratricopeptide (TPR) repeat protein